MKYVQVEIETEEERLEELTGFLLARGIEETAVEDPADLEAILRKEAGYEWDYVADEVMESRGGRPKLLFYLGDGKEERRRAFQLAAEIEAAWPDASVRVSVEDDSGWKEKWKEYFKPARITATLTVKPTWETYASTPGEKVIEIDPGMAFGTGTHETTSLCLQLMEKYMTAAAGRLPADGDAHSTDGSLHSTDGAAPSTNRGPHLTDGAAGEPRLRSADSVAGKGPRVRVLDVGCGSGILSIGAALLGADEILAVDVDPEAIRVTKENVSLNHVQERVFVRQGNLVDGLDFKADIVAANLMADLVVELSASVAEHLRPGGIFISSGILVEKEEQVAEAIRAAGFEIAEIKEDGAWCAIAARAAVQ